MVELLRRFLKICLLTNGPQDLPYSQFLFKTMLFVYALTGCLSIWPAISLSKGIWIMLLDIAILLIFCWICLVAFNKRSRFLQTVTALCSVGSIFQLLSWPLLLYVDDAKKADSIPVEASFLLLVIISWNLAVYAHIFRQSFNVRMLSAFVLTISYVIVTMTTRSLLFPDLGV